jgi:hypothetical protein
MGNSITITINLSTTTSPKHTKVNGMTTNTMAKERNITGSILRSILGLATKLCTKGNLKMGSFMAMERHTLVTVHFSMKENGNAIK